MQLGRYLYAHLTTDSALSALVGNRIFPVFAGQNAAFPHVVYQIANGPLDEGQKVEKADHDRATVTFHLWADAKFGQHAYDVLEDIEAALRNRLDFVSGTTEGVTVEACYYDGSTDGRDEEGALYLKQVTFTFIVRNT